MAPGANSRQVRCIVVINSSYWKSHRHVKAVYEEKSKQETYEQLSASDWLWTDFMEE